MDYPVACGSCFAASSARALSPLPMRLMSLRHSLLQQCTPIVHCVPRLHDQPHAEGIIQYEMKSLQGLQGEIFRKVQWA